MPPGGHSSSSHHSSSRSHHSSYSSHSSGGGHSSGPRRVPKVVSVPRPERPRHNQPQGAKFERKYKCRTHDYTYYSKNWTTGLGKTYEKGYYDETGKRYDNLIIKTGDKYETKFECQFCGTIAKERWVEGAIPKCPNCGANLIESAGEYITDSIDNTMIKQTKMVRTASSIVSDLMALICVIFVCAVLIFLSAISDKDSKHKKDSNLELFGNSIYVESIDRTLTWNDKYDSYYDPVSDCYVWYNTDVEPYVWQYWYEDISSNFGDYGWMEYELSENQWYIEKSNNNWIKLPDVYDASKLWYMTGKLAGTSYSKDINLERFGNSICVDSDSDRYFWEADMLSYKITDRDCFIRVNFNIESPTVHYWYDSISSKYSKDGYGGWMEYDYKKDMWFVEDSSGYWQNVEEDTSSLWHVEKNITGSSGTIFSVDDGNTSVSIKDKDETNIYLDYIYNSFNDDYVSFDIPVFYEGKIPNIFAESKIVDEGKLEEITQKNILSHKDEICEFFDSVKNDEKISDLNDIDKHHKIDGKTLDVTDWFDGSITIYEHASDYSITYDFKKVEMSVRYGYYYGEMIEDYSLIADQQKVGDVIIYVEGISFEFYT